MDERIRYRTQRSWSWWGFVIYMTIGIVLAMAVFTTNPILVLAIAVIWPLVLFISFLVGVSVWLLVIVAFIALIVGAVWLFGD
jgi:hypothetical protein